MFHVEHISTFVNSPRTQSSIVFHVEHFNETSMRMFHVEHFCAKQVRIDL
jgi:hypothetical protein